MEWYESLLLQICTHALVFSLVRRSSFFCGPFLWLGRVAQGAIAVFVRAPLMNVQIPAIADLHATDVAVTA